MYGMYEGNSADPLVERLVAQDLDAMRTADLRGKAPSFDEVIELYRAAQFLYPAKLEELGSRLGAVTATWEKLVAGNDAVFKLLVRTQAERDRIALKNSVCAFEYAPGTWQVQHLVSVDRHGYTGTLAMLLGISDWCERNRQVEHLRLTYRPDNPGVNRLFGGWTEQIPRRNMQLSVADYFVVPLDRVRTPRRADDPAVAVVRIDATTADAVRDFYASMLHPVELRSLRLDDPGLDALDRKYGAFGLVRRRAIFAAMRRGEILGAVLCSYASEGINFSFLENALEGLAIRGSLPHDIRAAVFTALLRAAAGYYRDQGRGYLVGLLDPQYADLRQVAGLVAPQPKQYAVMTFDRSSFGIVHRCCVEHYRAHVIRRQGRREAH